MRVRRVLPRDFQALENRRKQAARLFAQGDLSLASIARELKVSRMSVSRWHHQWSKAGKESLKGAGRAGRKPRLQARQLRRIEAALRKGVGGGEKGYQFGGRKGASCAVTLWAI